MFKVGQKVVCINDRSKQKEAEIKFNEIYTISEIIVDGQGDTVFLLEGIYNGEEYGYPFFYGYKSKRFRKIDDNWVDELLCKLFKEVEVDELVSA